MPANWQFTGALTSEDAAGKVGNAIVAGGKEQGHESVSNYSSGPSYASCRWPIWLTSCEAMNRQIIIESSSKCSLQIQTNTLPGTNHMLILHNGR